MYCWLGRMRHSLRSRNLARTNSTWSFRRYQSSRSRRFLWWTRLRNASGLPQSPKHILSSSTARKVKRSPRGTSIVPAIRMLPKSTRGFSPDCNSLPSMRFSTAGAPRRQGTSRTKGPSTRSTASDRNHRENRRPDAKSSDDASDRPNVRSSSERDSRVRDHARTDADMAGPYRAHPAEWSIPQDLGPEPRRVLGNRYEPADAQCAQVEFWPFAGCRHGQPGVRRDCCLGSGALRVSGTSHL